MKNTITLILCVLVAAMLVNSGFNKFFQYMDLPEMSSEALSLMGAFKASKWLFPLIAVAEIVGGVLLVIKKYRALGAIILLPVILGIFIFLAVQDPSPAGMAISALLLGVNLWVMYDNKLKYLHMIS